jgi:hypothetical protein
VGLPTACDTDVSMRLSLGDDGLLPWEGGGNGEGEVTRGSGCKSQLLIALLGREYAGARVWAGVCGGELGWKRGCKCTGDMWGRATYKGAFRFGGMGSVAPRSTVTNQIPPREPPRLATFMRTNTQERCCA